MKNIVEIDTSHVDDNGVLYIDGYTSNPDEEGIVLGYFINGEFYSAHPDYKSLPLLIETISFLKS